jgi:hypothetical protein
MPSGCHLQCMHSACSSDQQLNATKNNTFALHHIRLLSSDHSAASVIVPVQHQARRGRTMATALSSTQKQVRREGLSRHALLAHPFLRHHHDHVQCWSLRAPPITTAVCAATQTSPSHYYCLRRMHSPCLCTASGQGDTSAAALDEAARDLAAATGTTTKPAARHAHAQPLEMPAKAARWMMTCTDQHCMHRHRLLQLVGYFD